jgi:two-component system sensor histidine kinase VanS
MKKPPIFTKIFAYTMLLLIVMSLAAVAIFARQFLSFYRSEQRRQLAVMFQPIFDQLKGKSPKEIAEGAQAFYDKNQSFRFIIKGENGDVLFFTPGIPEYDGEGNLPPPGSLPDEAGTPDFRLRLQFSRVPGESYTLEGFSSGSGMIDYGDLTGKVFLALGIMLVTGVLGALLFSRKVTKPLEDELVRERVMEENQRLFFSAASHELKTPIAATQALVEGMMANIGDYKDHQKYLRECMKNLESQTRLVSEIMELVKMSDENASPFFVSLDLAELGNAIIAEYRPIADRGNLEIRADFSALRSIGFVRADRAMLRRALSNALANAVQNTPEHGTIRIGTEDRGGRTIRLSILNTGVIPPESLSRLFEPFYRLDPARSRDGSSHNGGRSGLGLTIIKKSLDRMGVPFALENADEGVLFWMDLPLA